MTERSTAPADVFAALAAGWGAADLDAIMALFADDAVYENVGMGDPFEGAEAIRAGIEGFLAMGSFHFETLRQVADDTVVMNERVDTITMADGNEVAIRLMGTVEVRDGLITVWRDYFDAAQFAGG